MLCAVICSRCRASLECSVALRGSFLVLACTTSLICLRRRPIEDQFFGGPQLWSRVQKVQLGRAQCLSIQSVKPSRIRFGDWPSSQQCMNNRSADSLSLEVMILTQLCGIEYG